MPNSKYCIANGDMVRIHYTTKSLEGSIVETSVGREPFEFVVGSKEVISGLSAGLLGKSAGERHSIAIPADQGFGKFHPELVQALPKLFLQEKVAVGDQLATEVNGAALDLWVQKVYSSEVVLDANHPLAGETLLIDVEIIAVEPSTNRNHP